MFGFKRRKKKEYGLATIDFTQIRELDTVTVGERGLTAAARRIFTRGGMRNFFSRKDIGVHTAVVVRMPGGRLQLAEMLNLRKVHNDKTISPFDKYMKRRHKVWIISIRRNKVYDDVEIRKAANEQVIKDVIEYDKKGIMHFVWSRVKEDKNKCYCSEYVYLRNKEDGVTFPARFDDKVSPYDLQVVGGWDTVISI